MKNIKNVLVIPSLNGVVDILNDMTFDFSFEKGSMYHLVIEIQNRKLNITHKGKDIRSFSNVWLSSYWDSRDLAYAVSSFLDFHKVPHTFIEQSTSKITDQVFFSLNGLKTPNTVFASRGKILKDLEIVEKTCGYPVIIKDVKGSRGKYSGYAKNSQELLDTLKLLPKHREYFFQSYIPNDYDWGILVANERVVSAEKSYHSCEDFRNNACNGAEEIFLELSQVPDEVKDMAIDASNVLNLTWSRADILVNKDTNDPYLLEVNRFPGITAGSTEEFGVYSFIKEHLGK